jgi:uncharacterized membrane protein
VPRSRIRRKNVYTPPPTASPEKTPGHPWIAPVMVTLFVIGLLWIVVFYITQGEVPGMRELGNWNLLVGLGFIIAGFVVSTRWH